MCKPLLLTLFIFINTVTSAQELKVEVLKKRPELDGIIPANPDVEILAEGLQWSEGPLWLEKEQMLLFSDVPANIVYKWTKQKGKEIYLNPSGHTGKGARGGELGSNGLLLDLKGALILCQHGDRRLGVMEAPLDKPSPKFKTLVGAYKGKKFNSPNDAVIRKNGDIFFTDPPYGLENNMEDPSKEIAFQGVYRLTKGGEIFLLTDTITRPNGIAFLSGENKVIIANSDPEKPYWYIYDIDETGKLKNGKIFYDATKEAMTFPGNPDGLKVDNHGNVFATGPGGIFIFNEKGNLLGMIKVNDKVSNCYLSKDRFLYVTANSRVMRVKLK
jgi:gluconolactonase